MTESTPSDTSARAATATRARRPGVPPSVPPGAHVRLERQIAASPARVWAAWTDPAVLRLWYCPNPDMPLEVEADVVVGGAYRVVMGPYVAEGTYTDLEPDRVVAFTWRWTHEGPTPSRVRVELTPAEGGTHLVLVHSGLADDDDATGHGEGWTLSLDRLDGVL